MAGRGLLTAQMCFIFAIFACGAFAQNAARTDLDQASSADLWSMKKIRQAYAPGTEIELSLRTNEMVQLDCELTSVGKITCLVFRGAKSAGNIFYTDEGDAIRRASTPFQIKGRLLKGRLTQIGEWPYLAVMTWTPDGDRLKIRFRIESDMQKIEQAWQLAAKTESGQWGLWMNNLPNPELSETERLAGFVKLWSEVKYGFAFFDKRPDLDWDKVLVEYLPKVKNAKTHSGYNRVLLQCMALLRDGHSDVSAPVTIHSYGLPFDVMPIGGQAVIVAVTPADSIKNSIRKDEFLKAGLKPGEMVSEIDGRPVRDIVRRDLFPYICASTTQSLERVAYRDLFNGEFGSRAVLTIKGRDGALRKVTLTRGAYRSSLPNRKGDFEAKELPDGILYICIPSFGSKEIVSQFEAVLSKVYAARGLILDVRGNGGGSSSNGDAIIGYMIDKKINGSYSKQRQYIAAYRAWGRKQVWNEGYDTISPRGNKTFRGPVVVLTDPQTFSAAEDFAVALHGSGRAKVVGERTGGSTGQPLLIELPGGTRARVCTRWCTYADGREFVGVGVIPDVEVHRGWEDYAMQNDRVLDAGIAELKKELQSQNN